MSERRKRLHAADVDGAPGTLRFARRKPNHVPALVDAFADAIDRFERLSFDPRAIAEHARTFSFARFEQQLRAAIDEVTAK